MLFNLLSLCLVTCPSPLLTVLFCHKLGHCGPLGHLSHAFAHNASLVGIPLLVLSGVPDDPQPAVRGREPNVAFVEAHERVGVVDPVIVEERRARRPEQRVRPPARNKIADFLWAIWVGDIDDPQAGGVPGEECEPRLVGIIDAEIVRRIGGVVAQGPFALADVVDLQAEAGDCCRVAFRRDIDDLCPTPRAGRG